MANEFYYPQEISQIIQSFLNARDLAQSSVLSKSWYISCPTRPVLAFNEDGFSSQTEDQYEVKDEFSEFCTEILNRYKTLNLRLDKFTLTMKIGEEMKFSSALRGRTAHNFSSRNKLAGKLVTSALELGVSEIELKLNYYANSKLRYDLPAHVFAYTSLVHLSVDRYVIDGVIDDRVLCSGLKSLVLNYVKTTDDVFRNILARCRMIENLDLCCCSGLNELDVRKLNNLVAFRVGEGLLASVKFIDPGRMNVTQFRSLRRLQLENVRIAGEFFTGFGSIFPCIEDLTLGYCGDYEEISISSHSVRRLKLILSLHKWERLKRVELNLPNISKFVFEAGLGDSDIQRNHFNPLPSLCFDNVSKDWESDVQLWWRCNVIEPCRFLDLRKFLNGLTNSRISLLVKFIGTSVTPGEQEMVPCLLPPVEKLNELYDETALNCMMMVMKQH